MSNDNNNGKLSYDLMDAVERQNDVINHQASIDNITNINDRVINVNKAFEYKYASFSKRLVATIIDGFVNFIFLFIIFIFFSFLNAFVFKNSVFIKYLITFLIYFVVLGFIGAPIFGTIELAVKHVTFGEKFSKIHYINYNGSDISTSQAFLKFILNIVFSFIIIIDIIIMCVSSKKQRISETILKLYSIS